VAAQLMQMRPVQRAASVETVALARPNFERAARAGL
jgi:hypothetical protein